MRPQPAATMSGIATWQQWNVPVRLTSMIRAHDSRSDLGERRKVEQPRTGHQDADRSQLAADLGEGFLHHRPIGDIGRDAQRGHALRPQLLGNPLCRFAR